VTVAFAVRGVDEGVVTSMMLGRVYPREGAPKPSGGGGFLERRRRLLF
jgi:hypothetical protein